MPKKFIVIEVDDEIAQEVQEGIKGFIDDFFGEEPDRIAVGEVKENPNS